MSKINIEVQDGTLIEVTKYTPNEIVVKMLDSENLSTFWVYLTTDEAKNLGKILCEI